MNEQEAHFTVHHDPFDRVPSEIFEAIAAIEGVGNPTQAELLHRRGKALKALLRPVGAGPEDERFFTIFDELAIDAWRRGLIPPKPRKGRRAAPYVEAVTEAYRKTMYRKFYRDLADANPELSASERLTAIADRFGLDVEWLNNVIRASRKSIGKNIPDVGKFPDIVDMWNQWETMRIK